MPGREYTGYSRGYNVTEETTQGILEVMTGREYPGYSRGYDWKRIPRVF